MLATGRDTAAKTVGRAFVYPKSAELVRVLDEVQETAAQTVPLPVLAQPDVAQERGSTKYFSFCTAGNPEK